MGANQWLYHGSLSFSSNPGRKVDRRETWEQRIEAEGIKAGSFSLVQTKDEAQVFSST